MSVATVALSPVSIPLPASLDTSKHPEQPTSPILSPSKSASRSERPPKLSITPSQEADESSTAWGSNFWVTLVDPQTQTQFFACPATGQVSWDPPVGNFVLPPSADGEWWELSDESRGGLSYYYHTKTGETVWERPSDFVIPLGVIQNTALGRRLSSRLSSSMTSDSAAPESPAQNGAVKAPAYRRAKSQSKVPPASPTTNGFVNGAPANTRNAGTSRRQVRRSTSYDPTRTGLPTIPASSASEASRSPPSPISPTHSQSSARSLKDRDTPPKKAGMPPNDGDSPSRSRRKSSPYISHRPPQPQSLNAAVELLATSSHSDQGHSNAKKSFDLPAIHVPSKITKRQPSKKDVPPSPKRPIPAIPSAPIFRQRNASSPVIAGKEISRPILNHAATMDMSPVKNRAAGRPIPIEPKVTADNVRTATLTSGTYPILPQDLASDIQQFSESDYAKQYFSTHRTGFIFRRKVPVAQMMTWQKTPLSSPLLTHQRSLAKDAVKMFKVIQHIMGDRERERGAGVKYHTDEHISTVPSSNPAPASNGSNSFILEEERWLLSEGLSHGELRDEIYCQVMKQLTGNPGPESVFKGWQLLCVLLITFPPSKDFETYLHSFIQRHTSKTEGRVDVMAKYSLRRLAYISRKGPRGKPPLIAEIETAADAAFNPSTFGESLDAIIRLQQRNYPQQKVPIILPFLADGILALGGTKSEGIFRVPGDGDSVSELKLRIDRGYYTLDGIDDPHTLASLMKLWLRELCDPLVPEEMYNECITSAKDVDACLRIVERLPTINRRVVLFVISFLQLFLEERTQVVTKMTPANLALVMAPNLLRCTSDSMSVVFTNTQFEQLFVYHLLLHLKCGSVDPDYTPAHGLRAIPEPASRPSKSKNRH